ncbi:GNAT family acetyltransferase [Alkalihalobacillus alcalophilus ATCC 27647 = CGMCC 1.3604]|uniref:GNAT family acetyltransferase n=1 Tax=Alkalihalobacillus alcalophilus ATCC 27647 = CGMCC 1.3604 TaxID=1218173 RepID=A0A094WJU6_ALKAL|nr:GNAT family N-acetyltransferase [Alkalihalobacillus alcalophilus]KGA97111.1 GNAT family acetyltransferase [Alkalihalobacillus alcalophilus ATCC 27647 = CGMCC 1.3604]MED1563082.1 GNAT family N-acetyltransferase [Alkalihalobacillus alcalophilus]THG89839.1 GNAT family acetyltransferase [Alkalihalobacillus alcalophilus ATCC 27647 = CGMCC 1.3604]
MGDLLVPLYSLPELEQSNNQTWKIRKPLPPEKHIVMNWVRTNFSEQWASEVDVALAQTPSSCFIAVEGEKIVGFACFNVTALNFFGPTGVAESARGRGIGLQLLIQSLDEMKRIGYAYAIIGGAGPVDFYKKAVGAIEIPGSNNGIYVGMLK